MTIDLHTHSVYSDGLLTPDALCALAIRKKVSVIALCDHDTTDGLAPMADVVARCNGEGASLRFLPAVELSTGSDGRTHILGYGADPTGIPLQTAMLELRRCRRERGAQMLKALADLGIHIPPVFLPDPEAQGLPIGRPHVARALVRMGAVRTMEQAFDRYLGEGRPAYVPLEHMTALQAIALLREAKAVPVLAHPMRIGLNVQMVEALITSFQNDGLQGVEVFHPSCSHQNARALESIARRHGLLVTGGSDFHGDRGSRASLGGLPSGWKDWKADLHALTDAMAHA